MRPYIQSALMTVVVALIPVLGQAAALEEIVVTAQKREERLLDIPMSITAIGGGRLKEAHVDNMSDLSYLVPTMAVAEEGPGNQIITLRGIGNSRGSSSLVGIYLDEIPVAGSQSAQIDLRTLDLDRVEVLRGPQGTLYGVGSAGGTIRFITKDPKLDQTEGDLELSVFDTRDGGLSADYTGVLNVPLIEDKFAIRLAATYEDHSGWIDQPAASREDINDSNLTNIRVKSLWKARDNLQVGVMAVVHRNDGGGLGVVNLEPRNQSNFASAVHPDRTSDFKDDYDIFNLAIDLDLASMTFLSSSSYIDMDKWEQGVSQFFFLPSVSDEDPFELLFKDFTRNVRIKTQEFRLTSAGEPSFDWTIGLFYRDSEDETTQSQETGLGGEVLSMVDVPPTRETSESWAAFGDVVFSATDNLQLGAGLRYFSDDATVLDVTGEVLSGSFDALTPRVYVNYSVSDSTNAYASVSQGFRSGGFNRSSAIASGAPPDFDPETVTSYEAGLKFYSGSGRLAVDSAIFYSEYDDIQVQGLFGVSNNTSFTDNAGLAEIKGLELSVTWQATDRLRVVLGGDVIDAKITELASEAAEKAEGDLIDFVPDHALSAMANYDIVWKDGTPGYLRVTYNQQGEARQTLRNAGLRETIQESDVIGSLGISVGARFGAWRLEAFGRNLLDEDGIVRPSISARWVQNRPRTVGITAGYSF